MAGMMPRHTDTTQHKEDGAMSKTFGRDAFRAFYATGELDDHADHGWATITDLEQAAWNAAAAAVVQAYDASLIEQADRKAEAVLSAPTWTEAQEAAQRAEEGQEAYVCPQCGPDPAGPWTHTQTHHVWHGGEAVPETPPAE